MDGLSRVGGVVVIHGPAARTLCEAVLIAARARAANSYPVSRHYATLAQELHAAVSAAGQSDVRAYADIHPEYVLPTVPIEQAATKLGLSKRQTRRLAPSLGGRIVHGRWLIDSQALTEHLEGRDA